MSESLANLLHEYHLIYCLVALCIIITKSFAV